MFKARERWYRGGWVWQWLGRRQFDAEKSQLHLVALRIVSERARRGR